MKMRTTFPSALALLLIGSAASIAAHAQTTDLASEIPPAPAASTLTFQPPAAPTPTVKAQDKHAKDVPAGPTAVIVLAQTPTLDAEGKQQVDPDGNPMFNPPVTQIRDKKGHPVFDAAGKPVFESATNLGYDENGKKIVAKKVKAPRMTPISISAGTLTVDGWTGKARLNYDIADLKFLYLYAPGVGTIIVSQNQFPGATEQAGAFNSNTLKIAVEGHPIELSSEKPLLGKKPASAWVAVDRGFMLPAKFPVFGYGTTVKAPYTWPGSKETLASKGVVQAPPLPPDVTPALLLAPCPAGMMRQAGPAVLPGQKAAVQACVPIQSAITRAPVTSTLTATAVPGR